MCMCLSLHEFENRFCFSKKRKFLFKRLVEELHNITCQSSRCRFVIFGSYLTKRKEPGDIDLILSIVPNSDSAYEIMQKGVKQTCPDDIDLQYSVNQLLTVSPEKLVKTFLENPLNKKKKINIKHYIELNLSDLDDYVEPSNL